MAGKYSGIPEDVLKDAMEENDGGKPAKRSKKSSASSQKNSGVDYGDFKPPKPTGNEKKQHGLFKKTRANVVLTKDEVKAIKIGRKKLRAEMKARGIKSKKEFELVAGSLGLYFDKKHKVPPWLLLHWPWALLGALLALLAVLFIFSLVQQMRGHFTINLSDGMLKEGFVLADNKDFENATTQLFATPAKDCPCLSINQIPKNIDEIDGDHHRGYFAYTYYIKNEGESTVGFDWELNLNSESQELSTAAWALVFFDGAPRFYALANNETGKQEAIPAFGDDSKGYLTLPIKELAPDSDQFELVKQDGAIKYYRVIPDLFESDMTIVSGIQEGVEPQEVHKFTVVLWLEGDDVDATDDKIGGHLGVEMDFQLVEEKTNKQNSKNGDSFLVKMKNFFEDAFNSLKFW